MKKYRISKYSPQYRDENGFFTKSDWTSYADIGKEFCGEILTQEKYIHMEECYIQAIKIVCEFCNIRLLMVEELEVNFSIREMQSMLSTKGLKLSGKEIRFIEKIENGQIISEDNLAMCIALILKDCYWCKLIGITSEFSIEFGYDLYVYIKCNELSEMVVQKTCELGIYIEDI